MGGNLCGLRGGLCKGKRGERPQQALYEQLFPCASGNGSGKDGGHERAVRAADEVPSGRGEPWGKAGESSSQYPGADRNRGG